MASGKSLELAQIKPPEPDLLCICGSVWKTHLFKNGKLKNQFADASKHWPTGNIGRRMMGPGNATTTSRARSARGDK